MTTYTIYPAEEGYVRSSSSNSFAAHGGTNLILNQNAGFMLAGQDYISFIYYIYEAFVEFDTSSIADTEAVSSVTLSPYLANDFSTTNFVLQARSVPAWTTGGNISTSDWQSYTNLAGKSLLATYDTANNPSTNAHFAMVSESGFASVINKTGSTYLVLCSDRHVAATAPSGAETLDFYMTGEGPGTLNDSKLVIEATEDEDSYEDIDVIGTPTSSGSTSATNLSWSHTVPAGTDLLVVGVCKTAAARTLSSFSFGGAALTQAIGTGDFVELWYRVNPTASTANITVTQSGAAGVLGAVALNVSGIDTDDPLGNVLSGATTATDTLALTTKGIGISIGRRNNADLVAATGNTLEVQQLFSTFRVGAAYQIATASGNYTLGFTATTGAGTSLVLAGFKAAVSDSTDHEVPVAITGSGDVTITAELEGQGVEPDDIANLTSWLKADTLSLSNGANVTTWTATSGTNFTGSATYVTNAVNGRPAIRFNGSTNYFAGPALSSLISAAGATVYVVLNVAATFANETYTYLNTGIFGDTGGYFGLYTKAGPLLQAYNWDTNDDHADDTVEVDTWTWAQVRHDSGNLVLEIKGRSPVSVASGNTGVLTGTMRIGHGFTTATYADMDVAEIIIYSRALTTQEQSDIESYLDDRYFGTGGTELTTTVAVTGSGDFVAGSKAAHVTTVGVSGTGNVVAVGRNRKIIQVGITGSSDATVAARVAQKPPIAVTGAGDIVVTSRIDHDAIVAADGTGNVVASAKAAHSGPVAITGSGDVAVGNRVTRPTSVAVSGSSDVAVDARSDHDAIVAAAGSGNVVVSASVAQSTAMSVDATSAVVVGSRTDHDITVGTSGAGDVVIDALTGHLASVAVSGAGETDFAAEVAGVDRVDVTMSGTSSVAISASISALALVDITGAGDVDAEIVRAQPATVEFDGAGDVSVASGLRRQTSVAVAGDGDVEVTTGLTFDTSIAVSSSGDAAVSATVGVVGVVDVSGNGDVDVIGGLGLPISAAMAGDGDAVMAAAVAVGGAVAADAAGDVSVTVGVLRPTSADLDGAGDVEVGSELGLEISVAPTGDGHVEVSGTVAVVGTVAVDGTGDVDVVPRLSGLDTIEVQFSGTGSAEVSAAVAHLAEALIEGSGDAVAVTGKRLTGAIAVSGAGQVQTSTTMALGASVAASGAGTVQSLAGLRLPATIEVSASGEATTVVRRSRSIAVAPSGLGDVAVGAGLRGLAGIAITGLGEIAVTPRAMLVGHVSITGAGEVSATPRDALLPESWTITGTWWEHQYSAGTITRVAHTKTITSNVVLQFETDDPVLLQLEADAPLMGQYEVG